MLKILKKFQDYIQLTRGTGADTFSPYEFCTRCNANLTLQKGFDPAQAYWVCRGCGEMLINPAINTDSDIVWVCDDCGAILSAQPGFQTQYDEWPCAECGFVNALTDKEIYVSEEEFQTERQNPYRGLADADVLELSLYQDTKAIDDKCNVILVTHRETGKKYIKKLLDIYDKSIYQYLMKHPIAHMPKIYALFESSNHLIVIEEYIEGHTVAELMEDPPHMLPVEFAFSIAKGVCEVLCTLHTLPKPIIHRDVKPSNIILAPAGGIYLLDMNVAKWYDPDKKDDTHYMGTQYYAAPEQVGYGFAASSAKSDIYAVGMLLNVMITGKFPKEERANGEVWPIIERCIRLDAKDRYTAAELMEALNATETN